MNIARPFLLIFCLTTISFFSFSATKTSIANGNWHNPATWMPAGVPIGEDTVLINNDVVVDQFTDVAINVLWVIGGKSLTGNSTMGLHGNLIVDGTVDLPSFGIGDGTQTVNNGTMAGGRIGTSNTTFTNNGVISCDSLFTSNEDFFNKGLIDVETLLTSDKFENFNSILVEERLTTSADFVNHNTAIIVAESFITGGGTFTNDGDVTTSNWTHGGGTATGAGGKFCVELCLINTAMISGTVDVCDASPNGLCDQDFGTVAASVTLCTASPCVTDPGPGVGIGSRPAAGLLEATIFPNPMQDQGWVTVSNLNAVSYSLSVHNLSGQLIFSKININASQTAIDAPIESGIYICTIQTKTDTKHIKFVVN